MRWTGCPVPTHWTLLRLHSVEMWEGSLQVGMGQHGSVTFYGCWHTNHIMTGLANGPFSSGGQKWALTGVIHGNMHVIVLSCTHLQEKHACFHVISLFSAHFWPHWKRVCLGPWSSPSTIKDCLVCVLLFLQWNLSTAGTVYGRHFAIYMVS